MTVTEFKMKMIQFGSQSPLNENDFIKFIFRPDLPEEVIPLVIKTRETINRIKIQFTREQLN